MGRSGVLSPSQDTRNHIAQVDKEIGTASPRDINASFPYIERRSQKRHWFTAAATALDPDSGTRVEAHSTDICLKGCYVDTMNAFPAGTVVELLLTKDGKSFHTMARVAHSQIFVGMGLAFTAVERCQLLLLEDWIAVLRGERTHAPYSLSEDKTAHHGRTETGELRYIVEELLLRLMRKGVLGREQGEPIFRQLLH